MREVAPQNVNLARGGLGWLEGFNDGWHGAGSNGPVTPVPIAS